MSAHGRYDLAGEPTPNFIKILGRLDQKIDGVWVKGGLTTATTPIIPTAPRTSSRTCSGWPGNSSPLTIRFRGS